MKNKETLKEAAERFRSNNPGTMHGRNNTKILNAFINGYQLAKKQDKKMYSEKEVLVKLYECLGHFAYQHNIVINGNEIDKWFEQFKKK
jgi:hypothetical protein